MNITFTLTGIDGVQKNLETYGHQIGEASAKANATTAIEILTDVRLTLRQSTPAGMFGADTGDLSGRYHVETQRAGTRVAIGGVGTTELLSASMMNDKSALVGAVSNHVLPVEFGRAAGRKPPPPGALTDWLRRHGLPESIEFVVARTIARKGIYPLPHLRPAFDRAIQRHMKNTADEVNKVGGK